MPQKTILIVDDSEDILQGMKLFLELRNYVVLTAVNVVEMHLAIQSGDPSLIILDVFISGDDGRKICHEIKGQFPGSSLKIILTSAAPEALVDYQNYSADNTLEKPFGLDELYEKVQSLLVDPSPF